MYTAPTIAQFKQQFIRDFPYGTDPNVSVLDGDIINAFNLVDITINQAMWDNQTSYQIAYGYLGAHFLVLNLRASSQGLNGQWNFAQNSKSVGSVSESFTIPQRVIDNPDFMAYMKTNYGAQYLNLVWPQLCGQMFSVYGRTHP
jgi:hypothetical protein